MGSWNGTCMLSHLPIISGDKVKVFILLPGYDLRSLIEKGGTAYCYTNGLLMPIAYPLTAQYNDYGSVENIETDYNHDTLLERFQKIFGPDIKVDGKHIGNHKWTMEDVIDGIERADLQYQLQSDKTRVDFEETQKSGKLVEKVVKKSGEWDNAKFSFVLIREDIYSKVIDHMRKTSMTWKGGTMDAYLRIEMEKKNSGYCFRGAFAGGDHMILGEKYESDYRKSNKHKDFIREEEIKMHLLSSFMTGTRRGWIIQSGAGSQCIECDLHAAFAGQVLEVIEEIKKEYGE